MTQQEPLIHTCETHTVTTQDCSLYTIQPPCQIKAITRHEMKVTGRSPTAQ